MDKTELLIKLGVDGSGANKQISEINKELKSMDKELKSLDTSTDNFGTNMSNMGKKADVAKNKITALQAKLDAQNKALEQANKKYQNALKAQERYNNGTEKSASETAKHKKAVEQAASQVNKYNREIADTERALNSANQELAEMNAQIAKMPYEKMAKGFQNVSDGLGKVSQATKPLTVALGGIATASINTAMSFEDSMAKISATTGATGDDLEKLEAKAREIGKTTSLSAEEGATALLYLSQSGYDTQQSLSAVDDVVNLAIASNMDLGEATKIVTANLASYKIEVDNANRVTDVLAQTASSSNTNVQELGQAFEVIAPVAGALGYTIEDTSLALGILANNAITGSSAGTALRSVMSKLVDPTKETATAMEKYNISLVNSDGTAKGLKDVLLNLKEAFSTLDETQKAELASTLAGQEGMSALLAIVNSSDADFNKLSEAIGNANGKTEEMAKVMADTSKGGLKELLSKLQEAFITIGQKLLPVFDKVVDKLGEVLDWFNSLDEGVQDNIINWGLFIAGISPVTGALSKLSGGLGDIVGGLGKLVEKNALKQTATGLTEIATSAGGVATAVGATGASSGLIGSLGALATSLAPFIVGGALTVGVVGGLLAIKKKYEELNEQQLLNNAMADETKWRQTEANNILRANFEDNYRAMTQEMESFKEDGLLMLSKAFAEFNEDGNINLEGFKTHVETNLAEVKQTIQDDTDEIYKIFMGMNQDIYGNTLYTNEEIEKGYKNHNQVLTNEVENAYKNLNAVIEKEEYIGQTIIDEYGQEKVYTYEQYQKEVEDAYNQYCINALSAQAGFADESLNLQNSFQKYSSISTKEHFEEAKQSVNDAYDEQKDIIDKRWEERVMAVSKMSDEELEIMGTSRDEQLAIAEYLKEQEIEQAEIMKRETLIKYHEMARDAGIETEEMANQAIDDLTRMNKDSQEQINQLQGAINSLTGKEINIKAKFTTEGYESFIRKTGHVSTPYGGKGGWDPALNDSGSGVNTYAISPYADFFGGIDAESYPTFDFYGLKDTGVKTLSLASLGLDTVSSYATSDSNATGNISTINYNYGGSLATTKTDSGLNQKIDKLISLMSGRQQIGTLLNIEHFENSREEDVSQLVKEISYYLQIHNKRW